MSEIQPLLFTAPPPRRQWRVVLAGGNGERIYDAVDFRIDGGALVLLKAAGGVMAVAAGGWTLCESFKPEEQVHG